MLLPGEVSGAKAAEKSAEAKVVAGNEPMNEAEVSQGNEGQNVRFVRNSIWKLMG